MIEVITGFGYYTETATQHIVAKAILPIGPHNLADGLDYTEVQDQAELDQIKIWTDPAETEKSGYEQKIQIEQRQIAIASLKQRSELPADYK
jgi:hypothetical protein